MTPAAHRGWLFRRCFLTMATRVTSFLLASLTILTFPTAVSAGDPKYIVTDLGAPPHNGFIEVTGINAHGQIIANDAFQGVLGTGYFSHAWMYSDGAWVELGGPRETISKRMASTIAARCWERRKHA